jgi:hypothetical protein
MGLTVGHSVPARVGVDDLLTGWCDTVTPLVRWGLYSMRQDQGG